jgi:hypothetical protein
MGKFWLKVSLAIGLINAVSVYELWNQRLDTIAWWSSRFYDSEHTASSRKGLEYLVNLYIQYNISDLFRARVLDEIPPKLSNIKWMLRALTEIKLRMFSQQDLLHKPAPISDFLLGVGWCDQINAAAARVLSTYFDEAEVYALADQNGQSNHTIGRVLDRRRGSWLYFDIWGSNIVIFEKNFGLPVHVLALRSIDVDVGTPQTSASSLERLYRQQVFNGWTLSTVKPSFWQQVAAKSLNQIARPRAASNSTYPLMSVQEHSVVETPLEAPPNSINTIVPDGQLGEAFFKARIALLCGHSNVALRMFDQLLKSLRSSPATSPETLRLVALNLKTARRLTNHSR